jgi:hypothetical protein
LRFQNPDLGVARLLAHAGTAHQGGFERRMLVLNRLSQARGTVYPVTPSTRTGPLFAVSYESTRGRNKKK